MRLALYEILFHIAIKESLKCLNVFSISISALKEIRLNMTKVFIRAFLFPSQYEVFHVLKYILSVNGPFLCCPPVR